MCSVLSVKIYQTKKIFELFNHDHVDKIKKMKPQKTCE